jgi:hypothetical protein
MKCVARTTLGVLERLEVGHGARQTTEKLALYVVCAETRRPKGNTQHADLTLGHEGHVGNRHTVNTAGTQPRPLTLCRVQMETESGTLDA